MIRLHSSPAPVPDMHAMAATTAEPLEQVGPSEAAVSSQRPALCITEKWIRERLNLQLDSLGQSGARVYSFSQMFNADLHHEQMVSALWLFLEVTLRRSPTWVAHCSASPNSNI